MHAFLARYGGALQMGSTQRLQISQSKLSRAERGYLSLTEAEWRTAAAVLGVAIDALLGFDPKSLQAATR